MKKQKGIIEPQNIIHSKESTAQKLIALASHEAELDTIRGSNYYKWLYRKDVELHNFERVVEQHCAGGCDTKMCHKVKHRSADCYIRAKENDRGSEESTNNTSADRD